MNVCDFHSHILPNADHGSYSVETSLQQLRYAKMSGVDRIIATPHFYPHKQSVSGFIKRRNDAYSLLMSNIKEDMPKIRLGAEVLLCPNMIRLPGIEELAVLGTKTLLIELPFNDFAREYLNSVEGLVFAGYDVILAHPDRYDAKNIEAMLDIGVTLQLNASSIVPLFRSRAVSDWLKRGVVSAIGSDIHGDDASAYRIFKKSLSRAGKALPDIKLKSDRIWDLAKEFEV